MKASKGKSFSVFIFEFLFMCSGCWLSFCQCSMNVYASKSKVKKITITNISDGYVLPLKKAVTLKIKCPASVKKKKLVFKSSRPGVAKVNKNGRIAARKKGFTYITVYNKKNKKNRAKVKVYVGKRITRLKPVKPKTSLTITVGKKYQIKWKVTPSKAAYKKLKWTSSRKAVCSVSASGKLTARKAGTAVITAKAKDGSGKKMKIKIKVKEKKPSFPPATGIKLDSSLVYPYMKENEQFTLSAKVLPNGASQDVVWSSSDVKVATVDADGVVTTHNIGTAVIYAAAVSNRKITASYTIRVVSVDNCNVTFIAHRGYSSIAPENTKAAFELAADSNNTFDAIECDVYRTSDGVFVISHDSNLSRIFGYDKYISECTYEEIKDLRATGGNGVDQFQEEGKQEKIGICLLEDYLLILKNSNKRAVIELKKAFGQEGSDELYELISSYGINDRMDIISFSKDALLQVSQSIKGKPDVPAPDLYLLTLDPNQVLVLNNDLTDAQWAITQGFHLSAKYVSVTQDTVTIMHGAGKKIGVWTVDAFNTACHYIFDLAVDCVTSNKMLF